MANSHHLPALCARPSGVPRSAVRSDCPLDRDIKIREAGRILERGIHTELLARSGLYARLHAAQFQKDGSRLQEDGSGGAEAGGIDALIRSSPGEPGAAEHRRV